MKVQLNNMIVTITTLILNLSLHTQSDRGGIGMEEAKKRKAEEEFENYRQKVRAKQQNEAKSLEDFR